MQLRIAIELLYRRELPRQSSTLMGQWVKLLAWMLTLAGGLLLVAACSTIEPARAPTAATVSATPMDPVGPVGPPTPEQDTTADATAADRDSARRASRTAAAQSAAKNRKLPYTGGAYFENDGPGENVPANIDQIPDAKPRKEALASWANRPYSLFGRQYLPEREVKAFKQRGVASWYGRKFHGNKTANGERYDMYAMTAAHPTLPLPSYARVTNVQTGQSVVVRVNDRGPFLNNRVIDLSYTAAHKLGYLEKGHTDVVVEQIALDEASDTQSLAQAQAQSPTQPLTQAQIRSQTQSQVQSQVQSLTLSTERAGPMRNSMINTAVKGAAENAPNVVSSNLELPRLASTQAIIYVQMGAFQNRDNATWVRAWVEEHFEELADKVEILETDGWFKVQAGPYAKRAEAQALQEQIRRATDFTPFVTARSSDP
jgi:rare lipoprotein A